MADVESKRDCSQQEGAEISERCLQDEEQPRGPERRAERGINQLLACLPVQMAIIQTKYMGQEKGMALAEVMYVCGVSM